MKIEEANKLTLEEALNYACKKIVEQRYRCLTNDGLCTYGNGKGQHCAVGWLLDEDNSVLMRVRGGVRTLERYHGEYTPEVIKQELDSFAALQDFHDYATKGARANELEVLREYSGLPLTEPHWQQWIDMGE